MLLLRMQCGRQFVHTPTSNCSRELFLQNFSCEMHKNLSTKHIYCRVIGHSPNTQINLYIHQYNNVLIIHNVPTGFPGGTSGKEPICQCRRHKRCRFNPWVGKISWRKKWQPSPVFLPGKIHGHRSLADYNPWDQKELHTTKYTHADGLCRILP